MSDAGIVDVYEVVVTELAGERSKRKAFIGKKKPFSEKPNEMFSQVLNHSKKNGYLGTELAKDLENYRNNPEWYEFSCKKLDIPSNLSAAEYRRIMIKAFQTYLKSNGYDQKVLYSSNNGEYSVSNFAKDNKLIEEAIEAIQNKKSSTKLLGGKLNKCHMNDFAKEMFIKGCLPYDTDVVRENGISDASVRAHLTGKIDQKRMKSKLDMIKDKNHRRLYEKLLEAGTSNSGRAIKLSKDFPEHYVDIFGPIIKSETSEVKTVKDVSFEHPKNNPQEVANDLLSLFPATVNIQNVNIYFDSKSLAGFTTSQ